MRIELEGYEIEIKARFIGEERSTKKRVLEIINTLSILYGESAELNGMTQDKVYQDYAEIQRKRSKELFKICRDNGLYDHFN